MSMLLSLLCKLPSIFPPKAYLHLLTYVCTASGTSKHKVRVFNTDCDVLSTIDPLAVLRQQQRSTPMATVAFHPHRMILACAATNDYFVSLYSIGDR